jgi:hypothetical protein
VKARLAITTSYLNVLMVKFSIGLAEPEMLLERIEFSKANHKVVELLPSFPSSQLIIV